MIALADILDEYEFLDGDDRYRLLIDLGKALPPTRNTVTGTRIVHGRSVLLGTERTLDEAVLDRYAFVRDFYLEQRRYKIEDGRQERMYEDFDEQSGAPANVSSDRALVAPAQAVGSRNRQNVK